MVAVISVLPVFVAVKPGIFPVPDAAKPIAGLEFVQVTVTPVEGTVTILLTGIIAPSFTTIFCCAFTVGIVFTCTVNVAVVAHAPADGVNVYVPFAVLLTTAGLHVPVMLLPDVVGNTGTVAPIQIEAEVPNANVGVTIGFTVTV